MVENLKFLNSFTSDPWDSIHLNNNSTHDNVSKENININLTAGTPVRAAVIEDSTTHYILEISVTHKLEDTRGWDVHHWQHSLKNVLFSNTGLHIISLLWIIVAVGFLAQKYSLHSWIHLNICFQLICEVQMRTWTVFRIYNHINETNESKSGLRVPLNLNQLTFLSISVFKVDLESKDMSIIYSQRWQCAKLSVKWSDHYAEQVTLQLEKGRHTERTSFSDDLPPAFWVTAFFSFSFLSFRSTGEAFIYLPLVQRKPDWPLFHHSEQTISSYSQK